MASKGSSFQELLGSSSRDFLVDNQGTERGKKVLLEKRTLLTLNDTLFDRQQGRVVVDRRRGRYRWPVLQRQLVKKGHCLWFVFVASALNVVSAWSSIPFSLYSSRWLVPTNTRVWRGAWTRMEKTSSTRRCGPVRFNDRDSEITRSFPFTTPRSVFCTQLCFHPCQCRNFTPRLVEIYKECQQKKQKFDVVFISSDQVFSFCGFIFCSS